jgi:hypothetical protein
MLIGMVLGDGCINVRHRLKDGKYAYESSEMRVVHSLTQKDYCEHKAALAGKALKRSPGVHVVRNGPGGKYLAAGFSISHPYFKQLKGWCYPEGKKTFTTRVLNMLTPEGIALWYMDDGSARYNINKDGWIKSVASDIATMCSEAEATTIKEYFMREHGIDFKVRCRKGSKADVAFYIQTNTEGSRDFARLIRPYVIPSMLYKLAHVADLESHECRASIGKCQCGANIYDLRRGGICTTCYSRRYYREVRRYREGRTPRVSK